MVIQLNKGYRKCLLPQRYTVLTDQVTSLGLRDAFVLIVKQEL